jgi:hypothetical protein
MVFSNVVLPVFYSASILNGLFAKSLRYAQKIILGILKICLRLFFSQALILNKNPHLLLDPGWEIRTQFSHLYDKLIRVMIIIVARPDWQFG